VAGYESWARFYDAMRGDAAEPAAYVLGLIEEHHPEAQTLLELGCGTGSILAHLAADYRVTGVDLSEEMLRVAAAKVPGARFLQADMTTLALGETFDAVVCVADAINHLRPFAKWDAVFARAHAHLDDGGVFVFDMNTQLHLSQLAADPPLTQWSDDGDFTMLDVVERGRDGVEVEITVFERRPSGEFRLHSARIPEISYPVERVRRALDKRFGRVRAYDQFRARPTARSERLHLVCSR
jgi:cyclopropane fatty-acyl-phospholipid synthase-like methyltransferase